MIKKIMAAGAAVLLLLALLMVYPGFNRLTGVFAPLKVDVDGHLLDSELLSACYINDKDRLMVPLDALPQIVGAEAVVDGSGRIKVAWPSRGRREALEAHMQLDSNQLTWGDTTVTMDCTPVKQSESVYVPLSWVAEPAQIPISWDAGTRTVRLLTSGRVAPPASQTEESQPGSNPPDRTARFDTYDIKSVPILMYHQVCPPPSSGNTNLFLDPKLFADQLDYLQKAGYTTITMQDLYNAWNDGKPLPEKPVILTFDDGYEEMYTNVLPEFEKRGMTGTFFIIAGDLDKPGAVSSEQVKEMHDKGMEIACHTYNHASLPSSNLATELKKSREVLEEVTGEEVRFLCYPYGEYDDTVIKKAKEYGFLMAVTTKSGTASADQGFFELKRLRINCGDGAGRLQGMLP